MIFVRLHFYVETIDSSKDSYPRYQQLIITDEVVSCWMTTLTKTFCLLVYKLCLEGNDDDVDVVVIGTSNYPTCSYSCLNPGLMN